MSILKFSHVKPTVVCWGELKDYQNSRKSKRVSKLLKEIVKFCEERNITLQKYSRKDIRFVFSNFNAHTKHEIAKVVSENVDYMKDWEIEKRKCFEGESHIAGAFDAVSLGITHFYMMD